MDIKTLVHLINSSGYKIVLAITGGGTEAIGELLRHGGGSATLLEAIVPYSQQAVDAFTGKKPEKYSSTRTARAMTMAAFQKAIMLQQEQNEAGRVLGIGATSILTKYDERKERQHELHIAIQSLQNTTTYSICFLEERERETEESLACRLIINAIALACNMDVAITDGTGLSSQEKIQIRSAQTTKEIANMLLDKDNNPDKIPRYFRIKEKEISHSHKVIFSGSFDPCHRKHVEMAKIASKKYGVPVDFEISLTNVDKPPMDFISLEDRISSIQACYNPDFMGDIFVTNTPLFAEKAIIFPESTFILGADTMERLFNPKYYRPQDTTSSLYEHFKEKKIDFLVFSRKGAKIDIPTEVKSIITVVSEDEYSDNGVSSTQIRKKQQNQKY
ncbi:hypothetical protein [uncultured Methanomethylovorans sp.]|uniref:hypothetical protein n=1 Tax=uncultured Methanomethylovorans sp. TaxID=183759 RepID=UPI002AA83BBB|nr:hypothetical protein [uncultured Methanomethylovorans sp.]